MALPWLLGGGPPTRKRPFHPYLPDGVVWSG